MTSAEPTAAPVLDRRLPPIAEIIVASLVLMLSGGIYLASPLPRQPVLAPALALLIAGGVLTVTATVLLSRIRSFAWDTFFLVGRWALLAYAVIAGMLAFVFIFYHTRGSTLAVLMCTLVVFAVDVPTVIAFTVARYEQTDQRWSITSAPAPHEADRTVVSGKDGR